MSSAEAFVRIQRLLAAKSVTLVLCGFPIESSVGISLQSVGLFDEEYVELFSTLGDALECKLNTIFLTMMLIRSPGSENAYIKAWFMTQKAELDQLHIVPGKV